MNGITPFGKIEYRFQIDNDNEKKLIMPEPRILHNPRCSKSRQTLQLLTDNGLKPEVVEYLKAPLTEEQLGEIISLLGLSSARDLMRKNETEYKDMQLSNPELSEVELIRAMCLAPKLIERPIVITQKGARIGRPPESVLDII